MSKNKQYAGQTSNSLAIFIQDTSSTTGGGLSGVTNASSGLVMEYRRYGQSSWTSVTPVSKTLGTYVSGGIVADGSLAGAYEVDFPDAAFAAGARLVWLRVRGVTNMLPVLIEIELDAVDYQDGAGFGLSRINDTITSRMATYTQPTGFLAASFPASVANETTVASKASQTSVDAIPTNPLLTNDARLNYIDFSISTVNTNILNLNNLSAKMNVFGAPLLEIPESGSTVYAFTLVVKDDEDKLVALDALPTVTAANAAGTNRSGNLSVVSNPSTGRYTFTYTVADTHAAESLRISISGAVSSEARYVEWVGAVVNYDSLTVLQQIQSDLSGKPTLLQIEGSSILAKEATVSTRASQTSVDALPTANQNRDAVMNAMPNGGWVNGSFGDRWLIGTNDNREVQVTGSNHVSADVHAFQPAVIDAASIAAGALNGKGDWLTTLGANAPANWINAAAIATDAIDADAMAASANTEIANAVAATQVLSRLDSMIESNGAGQFRFDTIAMSMVSVGVNSVNISVEDRSITVV